MGRRSINLLVIGATLLAGCAPASTATPGPTPTPGAPQQAIMSVSGFASYEPVEVDSTVDSPDYVPSLEAAANADIVDWLSDAQRAALEESGFVVVPAGREQVYQIYKDADEAGVPAFVTTDAVLHAYHILYDYALRLAELEHFIADLEALNAAMLEAAEASYRSSAGEVQEAAFQNLAFHAVAGKLLIPDAAMPDAVSDLVEQELELIAEHQGLSISPIFGYYEDYSQYVPRGHYTRNEDFERYFRAMMWYGRMSFHLLNERDPDAARRETRAALLTVRALHEEDAGGEPALEVWQRIYEPTAFFVGTSDDLTVYDYTDVATEVYGGLPDAPALAAVAALDEFIALALDLRPPAIVGGLVTDQEDPEEVTMGFRFMGQRFIPDSYVFQELVYNKVLQYRGSGQPFTMVGSEAGAIRGFPRGLDVQAVLGSARALEILTAAGDSDYVGYAEQLEKLQGEFADLPDEQWVSNLYWNWLHTLQPLLAVKGEGYPAFMQSAAWADKDLQTWLGSWTELRHDTILYAKQSYTLRATSVNPQVDPARGYVEPQPEVYARLAALTIQMRSGLGDRGLLNAEIGQRLASMEELLLSLKEISEKELVGESPSEEEYALIRSVGTRLEYITTFTEEIEDEITSQADERMALIADVHTDTNSGQVLEEAVGDAFPIYVIVLVEGRQVVTVGGVFSYYEFKQPMSNRLTDEEWQELSPRPEMPAWTESFVVP
jgi:hypothetical protein